ncbi:EKC/KEOPS complex subunit TPRKB-like [Leptopilina boulardi]|uniref:EKC/KEOPS complex subunit TPRKB-like n=1 Tax=Leptopilina boulardi TaxID=63433 RepID=UPI0021F612CD|nr:EKC/KEOPS complex subunit TPRKB-like [Leptopilina boulardi]
MATTGATTTTIPLDPESKKSITLALFNNVKNTEQVRQCLISGKIQCCLLKPSLIIDPFQIVVAANKAVCSEIFGELVTKTVFMEILYNLSMTKSISKALKLFGSENNDTSILAVFIHENKENEKETIMKNFTNIIQGEEISINKIGIEFSNVEEIKKIYKITETELQVSSMVDLIATRISVRDFASF